MHESLVKTREVLKGKKPIKLIINELLKLKVFLSFCIVFICKPVACGTFI